MPADSPFPLPNGNLLKWAMDNRDELTKLVRFVNLLYALQVQIAPAGSVAQRQQSLFITEENILLPLAIGFPTAWAVATGTASRATFVTSTVTVAQLAQRFMALEQDLISAGIMPTL